MMRRATPSPVAADGPRFVRRTRRGVFALVSLLAVSLALPHSLGAQGAIPGVSPVVALARTPTRAIDGPAPTHTAGEIRGRVIDAAAELPLPAASLHIERDGRSRSATSSLDGSFTFDGVEPGSYTLVVARAAYHPIRLGIVVPEGSPLVLDVQLTRMPVTLRPMVVRADRDSARGFLVGAPAGTKLAGGRGTPRPVDLLTSQGSALTSLVGGGITRRPSEGGNDREGRTLFIWGAKDAGARVTLDGLPLGAPLHLGGLLPVVDEDLMAPARMWTAGAPSRYDGGTDYVLDLTSRAPNADSLRLWATVDVLTERLGGELPLGGRGSLLAGVRRVDDGSLARYAGADPGYGYGDALARLQLEPRAGQALSATFFATREALGIPRDQGRDRATWENRAAVARWERGGSASRTMVRAGVSGASIDLPLLTLSDGHLRADAVRATVLAEHRWSAPRWELSVGAEAERLQVQRTVQGDSLGTSGPVPLDTCPATAACSEPEETVRGGVSGNAAALYVDHHRALAPWLQLGVGLRTSMAAGVEGGRTPLLLPRLALDAAPRAGTTVRGAIGTFSRMATVFEGGGATLAPPTQDMRAIASDPSAWMTRATATQIEIGASQRWYRSLVALVAYWQRPGTTPAYQSVSRHRGVDATWQVGLGATSLAASYSRIVRRFEMASTDSSGTGVPSARLEQLASLRASARVRKIDASVAASYAHGLSFASVVLERPTNGARAPADGDLAAHTRVAPSQDSYLRVDASLSGRICLGDPPCRMILAPYARVLNALDRRDAIFYYSDTPSNAANRLAGIPVILSLGMRVDFSRER